MRARLAALLVVLVASFASTRAAAEPVAIGRAIDEGARRSPAAIEAAHAHAAASSFARDAGSGLPLVPQATILAGARAPRGLPVGPEVVVTVQQEVSFRGLGLARKNAAEWSARAAASELERARLEGASTAALEWVELAEAQELSRLRTTASADAARLAKIADARATAGVVTGIERSLAIAEVGAAQLALLDAEGRAYEARLSLTIAMGRPMDAALVAEGPLEVPDEAPPAPGAMLARLAQNPAVAAVDARARQATAEVTVAHAAAGPTWSFGASVWREGSGDKAAAAVITVPFPFFDPARYDSARQATLAAAAVGRAERLRIEIERETRLALHEREHTREVRAALLTNVLAPLRSALATAITAYSAGTSELSVVLLTRRSTLNAEERAISALADVRRADIKLATLAGTLVPK